MGVPEEMREKLFVKFRRSAEAQTRNSEGSGLGLYIIKTIVERAGGTVGYRPHEGGGSVFSFALPLAAQATRTP
jgi:signal transduction histidine kinase